MLQWSAIPRLVDGNCNGFGKLWEQVRAPKLHTIGTNEETALQISTGSSQVSCPAAPRRHDCEGGPLQKCDVQPGHRTVSVRCREIGLVNNGNAFFLGQERVTRQKYSSKRNKQFKSSCSRSASAEGPPTKQINILGARQLYECRRGRPTSTRHSSLVNLIFPRFWELSEKQWNI